MGANAEASVSFGPLIHEVARLRRQMVDREFSPDGVTRSQMSVLGWIARDDGLSQHQLADKLTLSKVALGAAIFRLETSGFVVRQIDPADRRVKRIFLTKQGRILLQKSERKASGINAAIFAGIDMDQIRQTTQVLLIVKQNILARSRAEKC